MSNIAHVHAREVLDSRGNPTVEAEVTLDDGSFGRVIVPSGASTGVHEALELRDGDMNRYGGKGVLKAVEHVKTELFDAVKGRDARNQEDIDMTMIARDGTENKSRLGANALLGVSLAVARAAAGSKHVPLYQHFGNIAGISSPTLLPTPMMNVINGGSHADSGLEIQEFMVVPTGAECFSHALQMGAEVFHTLKKILSSRKLSTAVGDEGGFAPHLSSNEQAILVLLEAIEKSGYTGKIQIAMDVAASEFYREGKYHIEGTKTTADMIEYFAGLQQRHPEIISLEDAFDEDDWGGFSQMNTQMGKTLQLVGDDLLVTNPKRIQKAIDENSVNSVLIKLNQIGSVTETIRAIKMTKQAGWTAVISHRSGESEDTSIAHLAVGLETGQIKTGSLSRTDRISKYNQLLRIEERLGDAARFQGKIRG